MGRKLTVILDFDGVINSYKSGFQGPTVISDPPVPGVSEAISTLRKDYRVVVYSTRCHQKGGVEAIRDYLKKYEIEVDDVVTVKVPAIVQVDDRALTFEGKWDKEFIDRIKYFKPWTKRGRKK